MPLSDRIGFLLLGMVIGFVLGLLAARLRSIEEKVETVDEHLKQGLNRSERGFMRIPLVADLLYFLVLIIVVWGALAANKASNDVERLAACNQKVLSEFLDAVQPRTDSSQDQVDANLELQKAWYRFVKFQLHVPPYPENEQRNKANVYAEKLKEFVEAATESKKQRIANPYPTEEQLNSCVNHKGSTDE